MAKYRSERVTLSEIIRGIDESSDGEWWDIVGIDIPGHNLDVDYEDANNREHEYIQQHGDDVYLVSWPDHVMNPRFNSDASYQQILADQSVTEVIERNGSFYYFGEGGFTVKLWQSPSEMQLVIRGLIASCPQDAVNQARHWYGLTGVKLHNIQVYRGNDGWYDKSECIFEASEEIK